MLDFGPPHTPGALCGPRATSPGEFEDVGKFKLILSLFSITKRGPLLSLFTSSSLHSTPTWSCCVFKI